MPKTAPVATVEVMTADGTVYDPNQTYYFFDEQTQQVRQSTGLRRDKDFLSVFGLKVVAISKLRMSQSDALTDGQSFFKSQIETLQNRIQKFELQKLANERSLKPFLMAKE